MNMKFIIIFCMLIVMAAVVYSQPIDIDEVSGTDITDNTGNIVKLVFFIYTAFFHRVKDKLRISQNCICKCRWLKKGLYKSLFFSHIDRVKALFYFI